MGLGDPGHPSRAALSSLTPTWFSRHVRRGWGGWGGQTLFPFPYSTYGRWPDKSVRAKMYEHVMFNVSHAISSSGNNRAIIFPTQLLGQEEGGYCSSPWNPYEMPSCGNSIRMPSLPFLQMTLPPSQGDKSLFLGQRPLLLYFQVQRSAFCLLSLLEKRMGTIFSFCLPHLLFSVSDLLLLSFLFALVWLTHAKCD